MKRTTVVRTNGSGNPPRSIDELCEALASHTLMPEHHPIAVEDPPGTWRFSGNFINLSHVFDVETNVPLTVARLRRLVSENLKRPEYAKRRAEVQAADEADRKREEDRLRRHGHIP